MQDDSHDYEPRDGHRLPFMVHVPYWGTGPMLTDLMGGRLQAASVGAPALLAFIKSGKLRCIARVPRSACRNCLTFRRSQSKVSKGLR